jgi:tetratricopeptide (TPR) repeat protein
MRIKSYTLTARLLIYVALVTLLSSQAALSNNSVTQEKPLRPKDKIYRDGKKALRSGDYDRAARLYEELIGAGVKEIQAHLGAAFAHLKSGNYQRAYEHANEALKMDSSNARAYAIEGVALLRSGYVHSAMESLGHAFQLDPKEPLVFGAVAEIDYYEGRTRDSRARAFRAHNLDPDEPDYLLVIARASARLELFAEAAEAYERFLAIAPKTDADRRDRVRGLISFYRRLDGVKTHEISGAEQVELPFHLGEDRRPYMKILVNGREATFVIDTGSGFTVISKAAARRLGISEIARGGTSQGFGGSGHFPIIYGLLKTLQLGEAKMTAVPCFIRPFHDGTMKPDQERADGMIGLSVLANFLTELDYKDSVLRLYRNTTGPATPADSAAVTIIPFRTTQNGLISVETELDGNHRINAILDSAAGSVVVSASTVERFNLYDKIIKNHTVQVIGAAGIADKVETLLVKNWGVADLEQKNLRALVLNFDAINQTSGFEQGGIIGGDFLRNFRVTIDFARAELRLQPHTDAILKK